MEDNLKICFCCERHENPFTNHDGVLENPENFITINWFGENTTSDAHDECWYMEK
jgi:hypothetical protein